MKLAGKLKVPLARLMVTVRSSRGWRSTSKSRGSRRRGLRLACPPGKEALKRDHLAIRQPVQDDLAGCTVQWLALGDDEVTRILERYLLARFRPALNETRSVVTAT